MRADPLLLLVLVLACDRLNPMPIDDSGRDPVDTDDNPSAGDELKDPVVLCDWITVETGDACSDVAEDCRTVFCVESSGGIVTTRCRHEEGTPRALTNDAVLDQARAYCEGGANAWYMTQYQCQDRPEEYWDASIVSCLRDPVDI